MEPNRYRRAAAGHILHGAFAMQNAVTHVLRIEGVRDDLTMEELAYLEKLRTQSHKLAEAHRKFGWRLIRS